MKRRSLLRIFPALLLVAALSIPVFASQNTSDDDAPIGGLSHFAAQAEMQIGGIVGREVTFTAQDFARALGTTEFTSLTLTSIPDSATGCLKLAGKPLAVGDTVPAAALHRLTFMPATPIITEARFTFRADGSSIADSVCTIRLTDSSNLAPTTASIPAAALAAYTQKGIRFTGRMSAYDPEGDALTYLIVSYPKDGAVTLENKNTGRYLYTPSEGFVGEDSFTYVARDSYGNYSEVATVFIEVGEKAALCTYLDLDEGLSLAAALTMEKHGIMQGELVGAGRYFLPKDEVSSGDFVVMSMKAVGITPTAGETFFDNNDDIAEPYRPYIATAARRGYIVGDLKDGQLTYDPNASITRAEAALILSRMLGLRNAGIPVFGDFDGATPDEIIAVSALYAGGIFPLDESGEPSPNAPLSRDACAMMLASVLREHEE